jgi:non-heme chloroperoxidase
MLPPERNLEVRSHLPARTDRKPPLLFVHGGYCDAWCWDPYFLPWFAARGYAAHALSLRGHGTSGGRETLFVARSWHASDVERVAESLGSPPVLIGHSMGASVVEHLLDAPRAAQVAGPVPPGVWGRLPGAAALQPEYLVNLQRLDAPHPAVTCSRLAAALLQQRCRTGGRRRSHVSHRRGIAARHPDLAALARQAARDEDHALRARRGRRSHRHPGRRPATAELYETEAIIVPGLAHMMMLERGWQAVAEPLLSGWSGNAGPRQRNSRRRVAGWRGESRDTEHWAGIALRAQPGLRPESARGVPRFLQNFRNLSAGAAR